MSTRGSLICNDYIHVYHDVIDDMVHIEFNIGLRTIANFTVPSFIAVRIFRLGRGYK